MAFQLYRSSKLGNCLCDALEEMVVQNKLSEELAEAVLAQFDLSIMDALEHQVTAKATIKARLHSYNFYDNVWQFVLHDVTLKLNASGSGSMSSAAETTCDRAKVICVDAKLADAAE